MKRIVKYLTCWKTVKKALLVFLVFSFFLVAWSNYRIENISGPFLTDSPESLHRNMVGLVPGTKRYMASGIENPYFTTRIAAAVELYEKGIITHILVSGDNGRISYNEPKDMRDALVEKGIPFEKITLDYAGFDTYDSVIRANKIFGLKKFVVISQKFHNERAVYIARRFNIQAYGYNTKNPNIKSGKMVHIREYFARVKALIEVNLGINPTYLGKREFIK